MIDSMLGALIALSVCVGPVGFAQSKPPVSEFMVSKIPDGTGPRTLREAIAAANANGGGTISFAPGLAGVILLTGGELRITANVKVVGPGSDNAIGGNALGGDCSFRGM